eukprot:TRINITY_DN12455_c0_g1_i1.p1 TRINITY_DN12455_c0_g1~~TRINITY_DN12455_c0_g1_i1.p1  ORF type:complete len:226 (-),score=53.34 TRINITY_DN12455_c0_g1_i1:82-759(-)
MSGTPKKGTPTKNTQPTVTVVKKASKNMGCLPLHLGLTAILAVTIGSIGFVLTQQSHLDWIIVELGLSGQRLDTVSIAFALIWTWVTHKIYLYAQTIWGSGFDNSNPRAASASLSPNSFIARLYNAHVNMQEAFPMFAVPMLLCIVLDREYNMRAKLALIFVVSRILYQIVYMANLSTLRSVFYHFGFIASVYLAVLGALPRGVTFNTIYIQLLDIVGTIVNNFK